MGFVRMGTKGKVESTHALGEPSISGGMTDDFASIIAY